MPSNLIAILPVKDITIPIIHLVVDGFPDMSHKLSAQTTDEPLESGSDITDHAVSMPDTVTVEGVVGGGRLKPFAAWALIRKLKNDLVPIDVLTPWGGYSDMLIVDADARSFGRGLRFSLKLKELRFVGPGQSILGVLADRVTGLASGRTAAVARGRVRTKVVRTVGAILGR